MAKAILSDGRVLEPDLTRVTLAEWRRLFADDSDMSTDEEDALVARIYGMEVDELLSVCPPDYRRLNMALIKSGVEPLSDPNSPSASTTGSSEEKASPGNTGDGSSLSDSDGPSEK